MRHRRGSAPSSAVPGQTRQLIRATKDTLQDYFAPEFLGRIDLVDHAAPLDDEARARIVALHAGRSPRPTASRWRR